MPAPCRASGHVGLACATQAASCLTLGSPDPSLQLACCGRPQAGGAAPKQAHAAGRASAYAAPQAAPQQQGGAYQAAPQTLNPLLMYAVPPPHVSARSFRPLAAARLCTRSLSGGFSGPRRNGLGLGLGLGLLLLPCAGRPCCSAQGSMVEQTPLVAMRDAQATYYVPPGQPQPPSAAGSSQAPPPPGAGGIVYGGKLHHTLQVRPLRACNPALPRAAP